MIMKLDIKGCISKDQTEIVEELGEYFATIANGIGGVSVNNSNAPLDDFCYHQLIASLSNLRSRKLRKWNSC